MERAGYQRRAERHAEKLAAQRRKAQAKARAPRPVTLGAVVKVMAGLAFAAAVYHYAL